MKSQLKVNFAIYNVANFAFIEKIIKLKLKSINSTATKPEFVKKLEDFDVTERDEAILEVEITSPTADVSWFKDGLPLNVATEKIEFIKEGTIRQLLIRSTSIQDEGEYTCKLVDQECTAEVTVVGRLKIKTATYRDLAFYNKTTTQIKNIYITIFNIIVQSMKIYFSRIAT